MPLDPVTAVGLGAGILQFVDFTAKLVGTGRELAQSVNGATVEYCDIEAIARSLIWLVGQVSDAKRSWDGAYWSERFRSAGDLEIDRLATGCEEVATELLGALEALKIAGKRTAWRTTIQALKTVWTEGKISTIRTRLEDYRMGIHTALLVSLRERVDDITPNLLDALDKGQMVDKLKVDILRAIKLGQQPDSGLDVPREVFRGLKAMTDQERDVFFKAQILEQLRFLEQQDREHRIPEAHRRTFRWVFSTEEQQDRRSGDWSNFISWLEGDSDPLYWITGKAGSGKSTLMKFIVHNEQCASSLDRWSGGLPVVTARFYFWNSGTETQMSQEGLLRSILHDALSQRPSLVPKVLARRWQRSQLFGSDLRSWEPEELSQAFKTLVAAAGEDGFRLCLFVDGLDEFDGDHWELIELFKLAISFTNVKACLASRPWVVFEEAFMHRPSLRLEVMTYPDIVGFVDSSFQSSSGFVALRRREPAFSDTLIENIAKKSSGVFLWVTLVVRSLLNGLTNRDRIRDLQRRLEELPPSLEDFYQKIFDSIMNDTFYREHACQLFRLVDVAHGHLTVLGLSFADEDEDEDTSLTNALHLPIAPLSEAEVDDRMDQVKKQLNSCCKGLLEVPRVEYDEPTAEGGTLNDEPDSAWVRQRQPRQKVDNSTSSLPWMRRVTYLHQTVQDFLKSRQVALQIERHAGIFSPYPPLLRSSLLMIKTWDKRGKSTRDARGPLKEYGKLAFKYAEAVEESGRLYHHALLDEVGRALTRICGPTIWNDLSTFELLPGPPYTFFDVASQRHLASFVSKKILSHHSPALFHNERYRPLLDRIVTQCEAYPSFREPEFARDESLLPAMPSAALVRHLLASGTDPNEEVRHDRQGRTIWENALGECVRAASMYRSHIDPKSVKLQTVPRLEHWASIIEAFIRAGADPRMNRNSQQGSCIREAFGELLPQRATELERMLSRTRKRWSAINKFITPPRRRANVTPMDVIPFRLLEKRANASIPGLPWGEHFQTSGGERTESGEENRAPGFAVTRDSGDGYVPLDLRPPHLAALDPLLLHAGLRHTRPLSTQEATEQEHDSILTVARRSIPPRRLRRSPEGRGRPRRSPEGRDPGDG